jgi:hypothetical protein
MSCNANEFVSTRSARSLRIDSEIMVVADRVFGLVGFDSSLVCFRKILQRPFVCVVLV